MQFHNLYGAKPDIFREHQVNKITAEALNTRFARTSLAMVLSMQERQALVFHENKWFQLPVSFHFWEIMK